ncbi:MAG: hypothetical protein NZM26_04650 [Patescibacteria group bacterium]|nr:hypothetical protein [Patescibacteria group bacterium]
MENNSKNVVNTDLSDQLKLARLLLLYYDILHPFLKFQLEQYTVACCNIALRGEVKLDFSSKVVVYEIFTEKKFRITRNGLKQTKKSKISNKKYNEEKKIAKMNLESWTKCLLWGDVTTVRVYVDGQEA